MALREIIKTFLAFLRNFSFYIFRTLNDDNLCHTLRLCKFEWPELVLCYHWPVWKEWNPSAFHFECEAFVLGSVSLVLYWIWSTGQKCFECGHHDIVCVQLQELRDELDSRALSSKGLKSQLIARLTKALLLEEEADVVAQAVSYKVMQCKRVLRGDMVVQIDFFFFVKSRLCIYGHLKDLTL